MAVTLEAIVKCWHFEYIFVDHFNNIFFKFVRASGANVWIRSLTICGSQHKHMNTTLHHNTYKTVSVVASQIADNSYVCSTAGYTNMNNIKSPSCCPFGRGIQQWSVDFPNSESVKCCHAITSSLHNTCLKYTTTTAKWTWIYGYITEFYVVIITLAC